MLMSTPMRPCGPGWPGIWFLDGPALVRRPVVPVCPTVKLRRAASTSGRSAGSPAIAGSRASVSYAGFGSVRETLTAGVCLLMLASFMSDDLVWSGSKCQSTLRGGRVPCLRRE